MELWHGHARDMVPGFMSLSRTFRLERCKFACRYRYTIAIYSIPPVQVLLIPQVVKVVVRGREHIQPPPAGCPRAAYDVMVKCW